MEQDIIWSEILDQARQLANDTPYLRTYLHEHIVIYPSFQSALIGHLAMSFSTEIKLLDCIEWFTNILSKSPHIINSAIVDLKKLVDINPAVPNLLIAFLSFKGFLALQAYRFAHAIWTDGDKQGAVLVQNWVSKVWDIDIHPAAQIGHGIFIDHGSGIVIGETSVVEDNVCIWHHTTLGSTLTESGDRHPKIRTGALLCAGATILGNIEIGAHAIVAANAVVLHPVPQNSVVAGSPARKAGEAPQIFAALQPKSRVTSSKKEVT